MFRWFITLLVVGAAHFGLTQVSDSPGGLVIFEAENSSANIPRSDASGTSRIWATTLPVLRISALTATNIQLSWSTNFAGYKLESADLY